MLPILLVNRGASTPFGTWLSKAQTYGTITSKEQAAVSAFYEGLATYNLTSSLYHLYLFGGDDAGFANATARINKRSINLVNPASGQLTWSAYTGFILGTSDMYSGDQYANTGINPSTYSGFDKANIGFSYGVTVAAPFANSAGGWNGSNIFLLTAATGTIPYWGNPPSGTNTTPNATGNITSVSTTTIGTGIKTYVNGSHIGDGASASAIPNMASAPFYVFWSPATGGSAHLGRLGWAADHKALDATQVSRLHGIIDDYYTAIA